ncbi:MAG: hypothetical protein M3008_04775, partial [Chloroflexota bacterium]|nr:hypothetical protein [Chloroflexota bacterium]
AGGERAIHPLFTPLPEQWEAWTAAIQRLRPRQMFVKRPPPKHPLVRRFTAPVARLRTPDLADPIVDAEALGRVEERYLTECFEVKPVIEAELTALQPVATGPATKRRVAIIPTERDRRGR